MDTKEVFLNWMAGKIPVQPTFVTPWISLEFSNYTEEIGLLQQVKGDLKTFLTELSALYGLATYEDSLPVIEEVLSEIHHDEHPLYPQPVFIYQPLYSHWILYEYYVRNKDYLNKEMLYIVEHDEYTYKALLLLNALLNQFSLTLYLPMLDDFNHKEVVSLIKPSDTIWSYANTWQPKETKLKKEYKKILER